MKVKSHESEVPKSCDMKSETANGVPWHRLATAYGRATDFPRYFDSLLGADETAVSEALEQIALNIEHQSTLWPATPFATKVLVEIFEKLIADIDHDTKRFVAANLLDLFIEIAEGCQMGESSEHAAQLACFEDMLKEEYLWSEEYDEEEDEARYEEDGGPFPDDLFYSFYYYAKEALQPIRGIAQKYSFHKDDEIGKKLEDLLLIMGNQ